MAVLFLLLAQLASSASADSKLNCIVKSSKGFSEPSSLSGLVACQKKKLSKSMSAYETANHDAAPDATLESWQDLQRAEVRDYIKRHPERAALDNPKDMPPDTNAKSDASSKTKSKGSSGGQDGKDISDFGKKLQAESDGGKKGVTPEMASQIDDYLQKNQGSVSPDMQNLLNSVSKDGANLSGDTMGKLQDAAKQAKQGGLDLNTDKKTEDFLLAPKEPASPNQN